MMCRMRLDSNRMKYDKVAMLSWCLRSNFSSIFHNYRLFFTCFLVFFFILVPSSGGNKYFLIWNEFCFIFILIVCCKSTESVKFYYCNHNHDDKSVQICRRINANMFLPVERVNQNDNHPPNKSQHSFGGRRKNQIVTSDSPTTSEDSQSWHYFTIFRPVFSTEMSIWNVWDTYTVDEVYLQRHCILLYSRV